MGYPCGLTSYQAEATNGNVVAIPFRCKSWSCPDCAPRLKRKLTRRLVEGNPDALLTLTTRTDLHENPYYAFRSMSVAVNRLFKRMRRRFPKADIQYALVWERTKTGWPHAHILLRAPFIPKAHISRWWQELTGAYIVDIRRIQHQNQVAAYVTKYLGKKLEAPPGAKRFRTSRHFSSPTPRTRLRDFMNVGPFTMTAQSIRGLEANWRQLGMETHWWLDFVLVGYVPTAPP